MDVTVRALLLTAAFWRSRRSASRFSVYAMRMAAVFTLAVSTVGIRTSAVPGLLPRIPGRPDPDGGRRGHQWTQLVCPAWVLLLSLVILFDRPVSRDSHPARGS
jgi:hypothetical protein